MKILAFIGSARKNGATKDLLEMFVEEIGDEHQVEIIDCYRTDVSPCIDCRYCWKNKGCAIKDGMQEIYEKIEQADGFIMAAPMYFHTVPGKMKVLIDRFQTYWAGIALRKDHKIESEFVKKGVVLMTGGAPEFEGQFQSGEKVLSDCLICFESSCTGVVTISDTDNLEPKKDEKTVSAIKELGKKFLEA